MTTATTSTTELPVPVRARPHWRVVIHPAKYQHERIPTLDECWRIVERTRVARFGWEYPVVGTQSERETGNTWIASWRDRNGEMDYWRFYQSGQFVSLFSFWEDKEDAHAYFSERHGQWEMPMCPSGYFSVSGAIHLFTAIFEFASRLSIAGALDEAPVVIITLNDVKDRALSFPEGFDFTLGRTLRYFASMPSLEHSAPWRLTLLDDPAKRAREAARWFFEEFGYNPPETLLNLEQENFLRRRVLSTRPWTYTFDKGNGELYSGVTNNLERRLDEHKQKYPNLRLRWSKRHPSMKAAREHEKLLLQRRAAEKGHRRKR